MINLTIDGQAISVPKGTTVYNATKQLKIDVPIFCYQDRMPPFGACRVCLVEVEKMPKLQTSCTLEATEGMVVRTQAQAAVQGRQDILEFLLINHPLDCPICDRGGECPLQDQTLKHGPGLSRFVEEKRHFEKPIPLGPVLMLDRERCIVCARCTRFGDLIAGDHALELLDRGFKTEVGTPDGGPADSKFIGNTIMICPVGALTSRVYRFRARPWDNDSAPSTCTLCPVGCSMIIDSRDGEIQRTRTQENRDVNDIWMCDKGWFGYEFTYHPDRLQNPMIRKNGTLIASGWNEAIKLIGSKLKSAEKKAAFGGTNLTLEENYLYQKLMQTPNLDYRIGEPIIPLKDEGLPPGMTMTIGDSEQLSHAILLGFDLTEEFPILWLRLRQAINRGAKVSFIGNFAPEISSYLHQTILHSPGQELETLKNHLPNLIPSDKKCAIFVGRQYLYNPNRKAILSYLQKFSPQLNIMEGHGNSMGARFGGMHPELGPFGEKRPKPGLNAIEVLQNASKDGWDYLHIAGADPASKFPSALWQKARTNLKFLVVQDLFLTETARQADVVLPTFSYVEKQGNFVNIEGRLQKLSPGKELPEGLFSDAEIFKLIAQELDFTIDVDKKLTQPTRIPITHTQVDSSTPATTANSLGAVFTPILFNRGVRMKHDPHLAHLAKVPKVRLHPSEALKRGIHDQDKIRISTTNSITAKVTLDEQVAQNTLVLPLGFEQIPVHELGTNLLNGLKIEIAKV